MVELELGESCAIPTGHRLPEASLPAPQRFRQLRRWQQAGSGGGSQALQHRAGIARRFDFRQQLDIDVELSTDSNRRLVRSIASTEFNQVPMTCFLNQ